MSLLPRAAARLGDRRLGPRLLAAILLASSLLALMATAIQLYLDYTRDLGEIDSGFRQIENAYVDSLSNSLWSLDKNQIELQLNGLLKMRDVQFARVQGNVGERFEAGQETAERVLVHDYVLRAPNAPHEPIGRLTVGVGLSGVYSRLLDRTLVILATQATKTFLIALFILFLVSQWVTRHLERMARHARGLSIATLDQPLQLRRHSGSVPDELDEVARALNQMSGTLAAELASHAQAEAELRRHRDHLEELVAERTGELQDAKERAEAASRAKSEFLSRMSHELRTPLNAILGYAQILQMSASLPPERRAAAVDTIRASGEHLLTLIVDILDLSRIEAGKAELFPAPLVLEPFVRGIADIVRIKAEERGLRFRLVVDPALPLAVQADEKRLRQVLLNLLGNAVKFTDRGEVRFTVRGVRRDAGSSAVCFEVQDTGDGIGAELSEHIFQPFEQAGDAHRRHGGTGLGLAISRQLVRLMGGEIRLVSEVGQGSLFWFELALPVASERAEAPEPRLLRTGYEGPRRSVLVVDDVAGNREMLSDLLGAVGFEVHRAGSGMEALQQLRCVTPDLVLMDVVMPGMDGLQTLAALRQESAWQSLPVLMVSANASDADRAACLAAGADGFVAKPIDRELLLQAIGDRLALRWTEGRRPTAAA